MHEGGVVTSVAAGPGKELHAYILNCHLPNGAFQEQVAS